MDINELVEILGYSHKNKIANDNLKKIGFNILSANDDYSGVPFHVSFHHSHLNIELIFNGFNYFKNAYGEPINCIDRKTHELILQQIIIDDEDGSLSNQQNLILPFKLRLIDQKEDILNRLREDYNCIIKNIEDGYITFSNNKYSVYIYFKETGKIKKLYISLIDIGEKTRTKLELEIELQKVNILISNVEKILSIKNPVPELDWEYQSELEAKKLKNVIEEIFIKLQNSLIEFTRNRNPIGIYHSIKEAIYKINKAQDSGLIIDTVERELLCFAIDKLVEATGFQTYGIDISLNWRKW